MRLILSCSTLVSLGKTRPAFVKAAGEDGLVTMVVSTYGVDDGGDQVIPGAFQEDLARWKASGDTMPFIFSHQHENPDMYVGSVLDAQEQVGDPSTQPPTPPGLKIDAQLDMDDATARKVFKLLKSRRITQASFAYDVLEGGYVEKSGKQVFELRKLKIYETGPTLIGMQQETELLNVKDAKTLRHVLQEFKLGRVISAKNEELLRAAHDNIGTVLSALADDGKSADGKSAGAEDEALDPTAAGIQSEPGKDDDPAQGKNDDPSRGKFDDPAPGKSDDPMHSTLASLSVLEADLQLTALGI